MAGKRAIEMVLAMRRARIGMELDRCPPTLGPEHPFSVLCEEFGETTILGTRTGNDPFRLRATWTEVEVPTGLRLPRHRR